MKQIRYSEMMIVVFTNEFRSIVINNMERNKTYNIHLK